MIASGAFEKLFQQNFRLALQDARLKQRSIIELPPRIDRRQLPLARSELWYKPQGIYL